MTCSLRLLLGGFRQEPQLGVCTDCGVDAQDRDIAPAIPAVRHHLLACGPAGRPAGPGSRHEEIAGGGGAGVSGWGFGEARDIKTNRQLRSFSVSELQVFSRHQVLQIDLVYNSVTERSRV